MRKDLISSWSKAPYWSVEEGAALAYDLDPAEVIKDSVTGYGGPNLSFPSDTMQFYRFAERAQEMADLGANPKPLDFMMWARSIGCEFHPDWWNAVKDTENDPEESRTAPSPCPPTRELKTKELGTRERDSLLKLLIGMAIVGYSFDPDAKRSDVVKEINQDLDRMGVGISRDTIHKWLREGAKLLPGDWRER